MTKKEWFCALMKHVLEWHMEVIFFRHPYQYYETLWDEGYTTQAVIDELNKI